MKTYPFFAVALPAFALLAAFYATKPAQAQIYTPQWKIGGAAQTAKKPALFRGNFHGLVLDTKGNIYVADTYTVKKFDKNGTFLFKFGEQGMGKGQFAQEIGGIAVDKNGAVYTSDEIGHRVHKWSANGAFVKTLGTRGDNNGQFQQPTALAVDNAGNLFVADCNFSRGSKHKNRVQKFSPAGKFLTCFDMGRCLVRSLAAGNNGTLYVSSVPFMKAPIIQKISPNGIVSTLQAASKNISDEGTAHLTLDASGNLYVLDDGRCRVQIYNSKGVLISRFSAPDKVGLLPEGIAVDSKSDVYLAASGNTQAHIRKFRRRYLAP